MAESRASIKPLEKTGIMEQTEMKAEFDSDINYMCYGDTIMLNYTKKIFRAQVEEQANPTNAEWDGESLDEAKQLLLDD